VSTAKLLALEKLRDALAVKVKNELNAAAFGNTAIADPLGQVVACKVVIGAAKLLAATELDHGATRRAPAPTRRGAGRTLRARPSQRCSRIGA